METVRQKKLSPVPCASYYPRESTNSGSPDPTVILTPRRVQEPVTGGPSTSQDPAREFLLSETQAFSRLPEGGILKKCVTSQAVYPLSEQHGLKARERRYTAHEEGKHWE